MFRALLLFVAINTASVYVVHNLLDHFIVTGGTLGYVLVGVILGLLNLFIKPVLKILSLPFIFLTAGLFVVILNTLILWIAVQLIAILDVAGITLSITGVWTYVVAVCAFGIINYLFQKLIR